MKVLVPPIEHERSISRRTFFNIYDVTKRKLFLRANRLHNTQTIRKEIKIILWRLLYLEFFFIFEIIIVNDYSLHRQLMVIEAGKRLLFVAQLVKWLYL